MSLTTSDHTYGDYTRPDHYEDPLAPSRGCCNGCLLSAPCWAILAIIAALLTH